MVDEVTNDMYLKGLVSSGGNYAKLELPKSLQNGTVGFLDFLYPDPGHQTADVGAFDKFSGLLARAAVESAIYTYNWNSPFEQFVKSLNLGGGKTLTALETPEVDSFDAHRSDLLVRDFGEPHQSFIPMNFSPRKTISISSDTIRTSLLTNDNLASYMNAQTDTLTNADRIATYAKFKQVITDAISNKQKPVPNIHVDIADPQHPTDKELEELSILSRRYAQQMSIAPSALYNQEHITTVSSPNELVAFLVPLLNANLMVKVLANAFNLPMTGIDTRAIYLDELGRDGLYMIMCDREWPNEYRQLRTIQSMPYDPSTLSFNLSLVHRSAIGINPFKNAVTFSDSPTTIPRDTITVVPPTGVSAEFVADDGTKVTAWNPTEPMPLHLNVVPVGGSITPNVYGFVVPSGHFTSVASDDPDLLKASTYVDNFDVVHFQKSPKLKDGTTLTFTVTSTANENESGHITEEQAKEPLTTTVALKIDYGAHVVAPDNSDSE